MRTAAAALFNDLFDDAAMFPPADLKMAPAIRQHARHRLSWYADTVGPFVCHGRFLAQLSALAQLNAVPGFAVAAVAADGIDALARLRSECAAAPNVTLAAVEVPLRRARLGAMRAALSSFVDDGVSCYLEIPVPSADDRAVHDIAAAGLRLKLRTGGTHIDAFCSEEQLAGALVAAAAERLQFKCTAGLHHAVRHRDPETGFEHHGFLNVALAARVAAATGSAAATRDVLADRDPLSLQAQVWDLTASDVTAIRAMFCSFGTCSVDEPIADLVAMGLAATA